MSIRLLVKLIKLVSALARELRFDSPAQTIVNRFPRIAQLLQINDPESEHVKYICPITYARQTTTVGLRHRVADDVLSLVDNERALIPIHDSQGARWLRRNKIVPSKITISPCH